MNGNSERIGRSTSETNEVTTAVNAAASLSDEKQHQYQRRSDRNCVNGKTKSSSLSTVSNQRRLTSNLQLPQGRCLRARNRRSRSRSGWLASWPSALPEAGVGACRQFQVEAFLRMLQRVSMGCKCSDGGGE